MNMVRKISVAVLLLILAALSTALIWSQTVEKNQISEEDQSVQLEFNKLISEVNSLNQEIYNLEQHYSDKKSGTGTLVLLFTAPQAQVYDMAFPKIQEAGYTGTVALSEQNFPGEDGCMTSEQFIELLAAGWDWCVSWPETKDSEDVENFEDSHDSVWSVIRQAEDAGFGSTDAIFFPDGTYSEEYDEWLAQNSFSKVVHHCESGKPLIAAEAEGSCWFPGAVSWRSNNRRYSLSDAVNNHGNLVFDIAINLDYLDIEASYLDSMLELLRSAQQEDELQMMNLSGAFQYRKQLESGKDSIDADLQSQKEDLEAQIRALWDEINKKQAMIKVPENSQNN